MTFPEYVTETSDPFVKIEFRRPGYIRYINGDGKRWEVIGVCDKRAHCMVGSVVNGENINTLERAREVALSYSGLDCPVTFGFGGCCPFTINGLEPNGN